MCGEYGQKNARPHAHACLHGLDFRSDRIRHSGTDDKPLFTSELLTETWGKGLAIIGNLNYQTAAYVARYIVKKVTGEASKAHYTRVDKTTGEETTVKPEYITMSRRPGLGSTWFDKYMEDLYPHDFVVLDSKKYQVPKYYDRLLEELDPKRLVTIQAARKRKSETRESDQTPDRLTTRRKYTQLKYEHFNTRNL